MRFPSLTLALVFALSPVAAVAQESADGSEQEHLTASQSAADMQTEANAGSVLDALRPSPTYAALLVAPPSANLPTADIVLEAQEPYDAEAPVSPVAPAKGSGTGLGFMIGGAAALIGGLLIGGTGGNIVAVAGVGLGVYGAIVYF